MNCFIIIIFLSISLQLFAGTKENEVQQKFATSEINSQKNNQVNLKGNINTNLNFPSNFGISGVSLEYSKIYTSKVLLGFVLRNNFGSLGYSEGGSLDDGNYYKDSWGLRGPSIGLVSTYLLNNSGVLGKISPFFKGTVEYLNGKKQYKSDRYGRDKELPSSLIKKDKTLQATESVEVNHDTLLSNLSFGIQINALNNIKQEPQVGITFAINSLFDFTQSDNPILSSGRKKKIDSYLGSQIELGLTFLF